jgi:hypothetical protein
MRFTQYKCLGCLILLIKDAAMKKIFFILLIFIIQSALYGGDRLIELYEAHDYDHLRIEFAQYRAENSYEYKFFNALFNENGEEAKTVYENIFNKGGGLIKRYSAQKLMDYYYAKGYYDSVKKYQEYLVNNDLDKDRKRNAVPSRKSAAPKKLFIQVGAFGLRENAEQLRNMLKTQNIKAAVIEKKINGKTLHLVWINGKDDFESTLKEANLIREKYDLDYRIIKN